MSRISDIEAITNVLKSNPQLLEELLSTSINLRENVKKYKIDRDRAMEDSIYQVKAKGKIDFSPIQLDYIKNLPNSDEFIDSLNIPVDVKCDIKWMIERVNDPSVGNDYNPMMFVVLQEDTNLIETLKKCNKNWEQTMGFLAKK